MGIVTWRSPEATVVMKAREDEVENAFSRKGMWLAQKMQSLKPPVDA